MAGIEVYKANAVMKMLGNQCLFMAALEDKKLRHEIKSIENAYTDNTKPFFGLYRLAFRHCFDMLIDLYNLGVIHGIRKERQRRKNKKPCQRANTNRASLLNILPKHFRGKIIITSWRPKFKPDNRVNLNIKYGYSWRKRVCGYYR